MLTAQSGYLNNARRSQDVAFAEAKATRIEPMTAAELVLISDKHLDYVTKAFPYQATVIRRSIPPRGTDPDRTLTYTADHLDETAACAMAEVLRRRASGAECAA